MAKKPTLLLPSEDQRAYAALLTLDENYTLMVCGDESPERGQEFFLWQNGEDYTEYAKNLANETGKPVSLISGEKQVIDFESIAEMGQWTKANKRKINPDEKSGEASGGSALSGVSDTPDAVSPPTRGAGVHSYPAESQESPEPGMPPPFEGPIESYQDWVMASVSATEEWPNPPDFWEHFNPPPLSAEWVHPDLAPFVFERAKVTALDPAQIALNCLVAASACIRGGIMVNMENANSGLSEGSGGYFWAERPVLWGAVVGESGSGKGPALEAAMYRVRYWAKKLADANKAEREQWQHEKNVHDEALKEYYRLKSKGQMPEMPELRDKPSTDRIWTDDATTEAMARVLIENSRGKVMLVKDELAGWFGSFDAYGNGKSDKDRPLWLSFYESQERSIDRVGGGFYNVPSWGGAILGGIQPSVIKRIASKLGSDGMLPRFMIMMVGRQGDEPEGEEMDPTAQALWNKIIDNLVNMEPRGTRHAPQSVILNREASRFMADKRKWLKQMIKLAPDENIQAMLSKWQGLHGRLAITYHCISDAAAGLQCPSPEISLGTVQRAWEWMERVLLPHADSFYLMLGGGNGGAWARSFIEFVLPRRIMEVSTYGMASQWSWYRRNIHEKGNARLVSEFWNSLCEAGVVRRKYPTKKYAVNPKIYDGRFDELLPKLNERLEHNRGEYYSRMRK